MTQPKLLTNRRSLKVVVSASSVEDLSCKPAFFAFFNCELAINHHASMCSEVVQDQYKTKRSRDHISLIISTNTKEVVNDSSFMDVELNTVISVFSLDQLNVDSELAKYAEAKQKKHGQISPPVDGGPPSKDKVLQSVESSELDSKTPEVDTSEPRADKEEEPTIRAALQKIRFLSMTAQEFGGGPARSGLLTQEESFKVFMNITSTDSTEPMPSGFSECRERRQPFSDPNDQCFKAGSIEHTISALKSGDPKRVKDATRAAYNILCADLNIQPALDKGILDALVPALTRENHTCEENAARAIYSLCERGSPSQLCVLAEGAALQPYCQLLISENHDTSYYVLQGLTNLLMRVEQNTKLDLVRKLREIGVKQLLIIVQQDNDRDHCGSDMAGDLLRRYFKM